MKPPAIISKPTKPIYSFHPPDTGTRPPCDFRIDFDNGMNLKEISQKYHCDQRTVRTCILLNKSSTELGRQYAPTKLAPFVQEIEALYQSCFSQNRIGWEHPVPDHPCPEDQKCETQPENSLSENSLSETPKTQGIVQISREITAVISAHGYTGSERTVRNYIRSHCLPSPQPGNEPAIRNMENRSQEMYTPTAIRKTGER